MVEGIDEDEVLSLASLTDVPPPFRSFPQAETSGKRETVPGTIGRREAKVESGLRTAPIWKCKFFPSEVNEKQLREWHQAYRVPDDIEFIISGPHDRADDLPLECVAFNQAILATGLRLPFPRIEFNSLYSFKLDGKRSGWWYASVKAKIGGSVITQTPDSIKNWKKFWFFIRGPWQFCENDNRPDLNIPVRYHELRYTSQEPTVESSERARRARGVSESLRSSSVLITEENLIVARLSFSSSVSPRDRRSGAEMKDISALLRKKTQTQARKGKRKAPTGGEDRSTRPRVEPELPP
ncbi:hypothetical protein Adt_14253 [Abeliophyllum distichum]|uniref:Uncharacterized protein n=1 Tax=Abeliophyllum distichum TaxID=126358 RepID=A0ABD1TZ62_9LAMI